LRAALRLLVRGSDQVHELEIVVLRLWVPKTRSPAYEQGKRM
jgi:hypothetical protein